jgi:hypothetical protein
MAGQLEPVNVDNNEILLLNYYFKGGFYYARITANRI